MKNDLNVREFSFRTEKIDVASSKSCLEPLKYCIDCGESESNVPVLATGYCVVCHHINQHITI